VPPSKGGDAGVNPAGMANGSGSGLIQLVREMDVSP